MERSSQKPFTLPNGYNACIMARTDAYPVLQPLVELRAVSRLEREMPSRHIYRKEKRDQGGDNILDMLVAYGRRVSDHGVGIRSKTMLRFTKIKDPSPIHQGKIKVMGKNLLVSP
jgi:hypothetical protein